MKNKTVRLTESAVMLALATVLGILPILDLPYGGSITVCSMLPLCIIAYRHGTSWGIFAGAVYGVLQMFLGMKNVLYFTTPLSIIAVIVLDYLLAFAVLGLAGCFRSLFQKQTPALLLGALFACCARYSLHVIAGATVWAGLSIPDSAALAYSLAYNATYMLPESIVLLLGISLLGGMLDLRGQTVGKATEGGRKVHPLTVASALVALGVLVFDVQEIFAHLQDGETGEFIITGLAQVNWALLGLLTLGGLIVILIFQIFKKHFQKRK